MRPERIGWLAGVVLTVVGSFYLAGTVWSALDASWRAVLVLAFLALYATAFTAVGRLLYHRSGGAVGGRWMLGVAAALAPIHAMAVGGLWSTPWGAPAALAALAAAGLLHARLLRTSLPVLVPAAAGPFGALYLTLCLGVGLLPVAGGPAWLLLPGVGLLVGLWLCMTRCRGLPAPAVALLALVTGLHAALAPAGPLTQYAPLAAIGALAVLYVDAALARWRGVHRLRLHGVRGAIALALAGLALCQVLPSCEPLPRTWSSRLAGLMLVGFFGLAALTWRPPVLWAGGLLGALLFTLSIPDLARVVVDPLLLLAGHALGYGREPLPLAWYSLTLLPYVLACLAARRGLERTPWRLRDRLAGVTGWWTLGLSALLVVLAHTRPDDLRPALVAIPVYAALWLRDRRVLSWLGGTLPVLLLVAWCADLVLWLGAVPPWLAPVLVGLAVALEVGGLRLDDRATHVTRPLRIASAVLPFLALCMALLDQDLGPAALAAAGAPFAIRYALRARTADLVVALVLLDTSALAQALRMGLDQPLAYAGPIALSVLVAAQLLRATVDRRVLTATRYTAAAAVYATTMAEAFGDPVWSLVLLLLSLLGMAAGAVLRVRAFLYLGSGFAAAALACELLRFGLANSHFWALYLTVLGLTILAFMVSLTLWRQPLLLVRERFVRAVNDWE